MDNTMININLDEVKNITYYNGSSYTTIDKLYYYNTKEMPGRILVWSATFENIQFNVEFFNTLPDRSYDYEVLLNRLNNNTIIISPPKTSATADLENGDKLGFAGWMYTYPDYPEGGTTPANLICHFKYETPTGYINAGGEIEIEAEITNYLDVGGNIKLKNVSDEHRNPIGEYTVSWNDVLGFTLQLYNPSF